jgi:adenylate cyclase, class 2
MARNIELKARCPALEAAHNIARGLGAAGPAVEVQRDTYFGTARGRLKLRQRWCDRTVFPSQLIWYERPDDARARASDYTLYETADGEGLRTLLSVALGVVVAVHKRRSVYLHDHVRIHLDEVENLGTFLEFEAIVDGQCTDTQAHVKVAMLCAAFGITTERVVRQSYSDLLRR